MKEKKTCDKIARRQRFVQNLVIHCVRRGRDCKKKRRVEDSRWRRNETIYNELMQLKEI